MSAAGAAVGIWKRKGIRCAAFDADDAAQEAAISAWMAGDLATPTSCYRDILDAMRRLITGYRQRKQLPQDNDADAGDVVDPRADPLRSVAAREALAVVQQMRGVDGKIARLLLAEMTGAQIAVELGLSQKTVSLHRQRIKRAIEGAL